MLAYALSPISLFFPFLLFAFLNTFPFSFFFFYPSQYVWALIIPALEMHLRGLNECCKLPRAGQVPFKQLSILCLNSHLT